MPKATEGQMFTVTRLYNNVPAQNAMFTFAVAHTWLYLALRLNCAAQTNP